METNIDDSLFANEQILYRHLSGSTYVIAVALAWIGSILSIVGAGLVVYLILRERKLHSLFHRIMLGMCAADIIAALQISGHFFALPRWTRTPFARGNFTTCAIAGSLLYLQQASNMYSCLLAGYFLLMIRYRWTESRIASFFEPWIHILPWIIPTVSIVVALMTKSLNPMYHFGVCGFFQFPADCLVNEKVECLRGGHAIQLVVDYFFNASSMVMTIVGVIWTRMMYRHVRSVNLRGSGIALNRELVDKRTQAVAWQSISYTIVYAAAFFFTLFGFVAAVVVEAVDFYGASDNPLIMVMVYLVYILYPIQGLLNSLVYLRPTVVRWKDAHPDRSFFWCLLQILQIHPTPTTSKTAHLQFRGGLNTTTQKSMSTIGDQQY